jgi:hypothetical protein
LDFHLSLVFLKAKFRVLLKPPRRNLSFADATEDWERRGMMCGICEANLRQSSKITCKYLCTRPKGLDDHIR